MPTLKWEDDLKQKASRRRFLKSAAALAVSAPAMARGRHDGPRTAQGPLRAYVGTYSSKAPGGSAHGRGIYLFEMDPASGALMERAVFPTTLNPSWLDLNPARTHLYTVNEIGSFEGADTGAVSAYAIDRTTRHLTLLNTVSSEGSGPAYQSVHPSGKYVLVANYGSGSVAAIQILPDGRLGRATSVQQSTGAEGPKHPTDGPRGNFSISGHEGPGIHHAHMIEAAPAGPYVLSTDLATDRIHVWKFDVATGKLAPHTTASLPPGDGPRHFAFHPNGRWLYSLQEEASTLVLFHYDGTRGTLAMKQMVSALPKDFAGTNFCSEVRVSPDGKFVYAANRLHNSVSSFAVGRDGRLTFGGNSWTRGDTPRSITLDPAGNFLYSMNQLSDSITAYRINRRTGRTEFTGQYTPVGTPACMIFLGS